MRGGRIRMKTPSLRYLPQAMALKSKGIEVINGRVYLDGELVAPEKLSELSECNQDILKCLEEYNEYVEIEQNITDYEAAETLDLICYNGKFYDQQELRPLKEKDVIELIHKKYRKFSAEKIMSTMKIAKTIKQIDKIPQYQKPDDTVLNIDNGFRGNDTFYKLIKYYVTQPKQEYLMLIKSDGGKGKSTMTNFFKYMFKDECFSGDLKRMNNFSAYAWASARLLIFNDCDSSRIESPDILKQISGGDEMSLEGKGINAVSGSIDANMIFIMNEPLSYNVLDSGLQRRFVELPWDDIPGDKTDKWVKYNWTREEIAFQINRALEYDDFDFEELQRQTIKESLSRLEAFKCICGPNLSECYNQYQQTQKRYQWTRSHFNQYIKLVQKYYTHREYLEELHKLSQEEAVPYAFEIIEEGGR